MLDMVIAIRLLAVCNTPPNPGVALQSGTGDSKTWSLSQVSPLAIGDLLFDELPDNQ
ncbi:MAG: hypothetical protein OXF20_01535 [Gammaproteobacteria bacterium]|nr:hypothetical protein [Gammaproteobacteria bacterium]